MRRIAFAMLALAAAVTSSRADGQRADAPGGKNVLFVCEHGTVKSLLAKVYFEQYAREVGLMMRAVAARSRARVHQLVDSLKAAEQARPQRPTIRTTSPSGSTSARRSPAPT